MRVIAIGKNSEEYSLKRFSEVCKSKKINIDTFAYNDFSFVSDPEITLFDPSINPADYTHAIFRPNRDLNYIRFAMINYFVKQNPTIRIFNETVLRSTIGTYNKFIQFMELGNQQIKIPKTFFTSKTDYIHKLIEKENVLIQKLTDGSNGKNINLIKSINDVALTEISDSVFQEYIPHSKQIRVITVGVEVVGAIEKEKENDKVTSNSGKAKEMNLTSLPTILIDSTLKAAKLLGLEYSGADWIQHSKTGEYYLVEVNMFPAFKQMEEASDLNVTEKIIDYLAST